MSNKWFKFYGGDYLSDPKIDRLSPLERSCWITLLCLASMTEDGVVEFLTVETLLNKSGIQFDPYKPEEWEKALSVITKFKNMRMIEPTNDGSIIVLNWDKRQEKSAMTGYERVKKYRENKKKMSVDNGNDNADNEMITDRIEENRIEENRIEVIHTPKKSKKKQSSNFGYEETFEEFWKHYPEKVAKGKAYDSWQKLSVAEKELCSPAIQAQVEGKHFRNNRGEDFIPHPTTWLNQRRWEDEVKSKTKVEVLDYRTKK